MNSITLTSSQAKEIVENRRLELFSPCEVDDLPEACSIMDARISEVTGWGVFDYVGSDGKQTVGGTMRMRPPHQIGDVVLVKEPCIVELNYDRSVDVFYTNKPIGKHLGEPVSTGLSAPKNYQKGWGECTELYPADEMPEWAIRTKAKATEIELQLHEGKLRWREVWEVVE